MVGVWSRFTDLTTKFTWTQKPYHRSNKLRGKYIIPYLWLFAWSFALPCMETFYGFNSYTLRVHILRIKNVTQHEQLCSGSGICAKWIARYNENGCTHVLEWICGWALICFRFIQFFTCSSLSLRDFMHAIPFCRTLYKTLLQICIYQFGLTCSYR